MSEIIGINGTKVSIGMDDGSIAEVPIAAVGYPDPRIGDEVKVYRNDDQVIVRKANNQQAATALPTDIPAGANVKKLNKHVFCWIGTFLVGSLGVDRFMRGQIGLGVFKLLLCTFGWVLFIVPGLVGSIWCLVDWIVTLTKVYGGAFNDSEDVVFVNGEYAR